MTRNFLKIFLGFFLSTGLANAAAFQFGGIRHDAVAVTSSGTTTQLTTTDNQVRIVQGSSTDTEKLPDATTLQKGYWYFFINQSSTTLTVANSSGSGITNLGYGGTALLYVSSTATTGGPWAYTQGMLQDGAAHKYLGTCASAQVVDWAASKSFSITLQNSQNCAFSYINQSAGQAITIDINQPTSGGGTGTASWASTKFAGGSVPTITTGNSATDTCTLRYNGADTRASCVQNMQ